MASPDRPSSAAFSEVMSVFLGGVILVAVASSCRVHIRSRQDSPPPPLGESPIADADIDEIRAACSLSFSSDIEEALVRIAKRPLGAEAQVAMIRLSSRHVGHSSSKLKVFEAVVRNPNFCDTAKRCMLDHIDQLAFESDKRKILELLASARVHHDIPPATEI